MTDREYSAPLSFQWLRPRLRLPLLLLFAFGVFGLLPWRWDSLLASAAQSWAVSDEMRPASAAVVLDGGDVRPYSAARLYKSGFVRTVLVDSDDNRKLLVALGVPPSAIQTFGRGLKSTYEEACALAHWTSKNNAQRMIIPTELFFSRRVKWIFTHNLNGLGAEIVVDVVPISQYQANNWWMRQVGREQFEKEIVKYAFYRARYFLSNCPADNARNSTDF